MADMDKKPSRTVLQNAKTPQPQFLRGAQGFQLIQERFQL